MLRNIKIIFLFIIFLACNRKNDNKDTYDYKVISKNKTVYLDFSNLSKNKIHSNEYNIEPTSVEKQVIINDSIFVTHSQLNFVPVEGDTILFNLYRVGYQYHPVYLEYETIEKYLPNVLSSVSFCDTTYYLKDLLNNSDLLLRSNTEQLPPFNYTLGYGKALYFVLNNKEYFIVCLSHLFSGNTTLLEGKFIVFYKDEESKCYKLISADKYAHEHSDLSSFNDFNNDGVLDYLRIEQTEQKKNVIVPYTLKEGAFIPMRDYYILLDKKKEKILCDSINWFYPIKGCE